MSCVEYDWAWFILNISGICLKQIFGHRQDYIAFSGGNDQIFNSRKLLIYQYKHRSWQEIRLESGIELRNSSLTLMSGTIVFVDSSHVEGGNFKNRFWFGSCTCWRLWLFGSDRFIRDDYGTTNRVLFKKKVLNGIILINDIIQE